MSKHQQKPKAPTPVKPDPKERIEARRLRRYKALAKKGTYGIPIHEGMSLTEIKKVEALVREEAAKRGF